MPSFIWHRDSQEAFDNPYEYDAQEQFDREAARLLKALFEDIAHNDHRYYQDERTPEKAIWLLHLDALGSIADAHDNLQRKRHRVLPHLSRSIQETLDLAAVFSTRTPQSTALLTKWFKGKIISRAEFTPLLPPIDPAAQHQRKTRYGRLSGYTHRTYHALMEGYCLARDGHIFHDQSGMGFSHPPQASGASMLPHTISVYYTIIAADIWYLTDELVTRGTMTQEHLNHAIKENLDEESVPRRFFPAGNHPSAREQVRGQLRKGIPLTCISPPYPNRGISEVDATQDENTSE